MMISREEFAKGFNAVMRKQLSPAEFARMAVEYLNSPEYNRWKAARAAEDLKQWREGREYLMALVEAERKTGTKIETEIIPLKDGHDSVKVTVNDYSSVCFPSWFCKESVDMNWRHIMEGKKDSKRPCGNRDCGTSTSIDDITITFGRGRLSDQGFWSIPCVVCAADFKKAHPERSVWPVENAPQPG